MVIVIYILKVSKILLKNTIFNKKTTVIAMTVVRVATKKLLLQL
jgi:hypothetical protein